jgi:hypothetical protein
MSIGGDDMKTIHAIALALLVVTIAAGCGGGSSNDDDTGSPSAASDSKPARYSECMRKNGVPEFPDPVDGRLMLKAQKGSGLDPSSPEFQQAQQACRSLAPSGNAKGGPQSAEVQEQAQRFSACMRENGVPDFPDPDVSGGGIKITGVNPESPQFQSALEACRDLQPGGGAP